jgi:DNA-binding transcriptional regulator GbsR (MarR family)
LSASDALLSFNGTPSYVMIQPKLCKPVSLSLVAHLSMPTDHKQKRFHLQETVKNLESELAAQEKNVEAVKQILVRGMSARAIA